MRLAKVFAAVFVVALCASMVTHAQEAQEKKQSARATKLVKPWVDMSSLSDEQKSRIIEIHREALDKINAIRKQEREDIMALLSEEQKREARELMSKRKQESTAGGNED
jgi:Spy/CpxP family protein refolding chaperone